MKDPAEADDCLTRSANLDRATTQLDQALAGATAAVNRVNQGPGSPTTSSTGRARRTPSPRSAALRASWRRRSRASGRATGSRIAAIYGDDATQQLVGDLNKITRDAREIVAGIRAGKGTVGALMVDPSVYEDVKILLGNVERNKALRALVRYSIEKDGEPAQVRVVDPPSRAPATATGRRTLRQRRTAVGAAGRIGAD